MRKQVSKSNDLDRLISSSLSEGTGGFLHFHGEIKTRKAIKLERNYLKKKKKKRIETVRELFSVQEQVNLSHVIINLGSCKKLVRDL